MTLEKFLKQKRLEANLTQGQLAESLGYESPQFISNSERGKCGYPVAQFPLIGKLLGVRVMDMIEMRGEDYKAHMNLQLGGKAWKKSLGAGY